MATVIKPKRGSGAPGSGDLAQYEIAIDITNHKLYYSPDGTTNELLSGSTDIVEDLTPQLGGDLDVNDNAIVNDGSNSYFLIGSDTTLTGGDLFSTGNLAGPINVATATPDNSNLTVVGGRSNKVTLTQDIGTGGANSERVRFNYDEAIIDPAGFDLTTTSTGRGFQGAFNNIKINQSDSVNASSVGTITGSFTYLNQGSIDGGLTIDRLQGQMVGIFANDSDITIGDVKGFAYERYSSFANLTGTEYSFYSGVSGATLLNDGPAIISGLNYPTSDGSDGQVLTTDGLGNLTFEDGATSIDDLTDVDTTTTAPLTGQVLKWNGTNWVPDDDTGITAVIDDTTPQLGGTLDVNDNNIVNDGSNDYFLLNSDTTLTGGDLFSTGNLTGAISVAEGTPDNSNLTVVGGRTGKVTLTQDIGSGGANSERVRFNYDEAIIDPAGFDLTTSSNGRGFQADFNNVKINQSDSGNTSNIGTLTGQYTYLNQGSISGTLNIDRLNGVMAGIFLNDSDVTIGDIKGFAYERYSSLANLTGTEYSFYSGVSGAELFNSGNIETASKVIATGDIETDGIVYARGGIENDGNSVDIGTDGDRFEKIYVNQLGDNILLDLDNGALGVNSIQGNEDQNLSMFCNSGFQVQFQVGGRDAVYYKEGEVQMFTGLRLGNCTTGASDPGTASEGDLFINTTSGTLKRYNGSSWDDIITQSGTTVFSTTDSTIVFYNGSSWRKVSDSAL